MNRLSRADILTMFGYKAGTKLYNLLYSSCANFCCIIKNCLGISSGGNAGLVLNQRGDWVTAGGGGSQNLSSVLVVGNTSGANDIVFDDTQGLFFDNSSRLREGTIDAGLGGSNGIAQICAVGYELKWEAGRLYVMDGNGTGIRQSLYNFTTAPTVNDDVTKGYGIGSLWTLDDNTTYVCSDASTGAAVWARFVSTPSVQFFVSSATVTPVFGNDLVVITAQAAGLTLANPTGSWVQGKDLVIRIKDNGTPRSIAYDTKYRAIGVTLPTTTVANKTTYLGIVYNSTDDTFDIIGVTTQA